METRQITEIKVYGLILNPMRGNTEAGSLVAISYNRAKIIDWYDSLLEVEPYVEADSGSFECHGDIHNWHKCFKKGSPLEWYNPCDKDFAMNRYGQGIREMWVEETKLNDFVFRNVDTCFIQ